MIITPKRHRCQYQLRCARVPPGAEVFNLDGCQSSLAADGTSVTCLCEEVGSFAALSFRLMPRTNLELEPGWQGRMAQALWREPLWLVAAAVYVCSLAAALWFDARLLYVGSERKLPHWLLPRNRSRFSALLKVVLTRSALLRVFHVYPGLTVYTHAQLVQVHC